MTRGYLCALRIAKKIISQSQIIEMPFDERPKRVRRRAYDRFLMHVEARVDERWQARQLPIFIHDPVVARVGSLIDDLRSRRAVDMHDSGAMLLHPFRAVDRDRHKLRGISCPV